MTHWRPIVRDGATKDMGHPHSKYKHLYVVVRLNRPLPETENLGRSEGDVMLTKAFFDYEDAEQEASRLNELNAEYSHYFVSIARLVA